MTRLLVLSALLLFVPDPADAATLKVPSQHATINAAVAAANPGDVIEIAKGVYHESVGIGDKAALRIVGKKGAIVDGDGLGSCLSIVDCEELVVEGLTLQGAGTDPLCTVTACTDVDLVRLTLRDSSGSGVVFEDDTLLCSVVDSRVEGLVGSGVVTGGSGIVIARNRIRDLGGSAVDARGVAHIVTGNEISDALAGIVIGGPPIATSPDCFVSDNRITKCITYAIDVADSELTYVFANTIGSPGIAGIRATNCVETIVDGNSITKAGTAGVVFTASVMGVVSRQSVKRSASAGIRLATGSNQTLVAANTVVKAGMFAFHVESDGNVLVSNKAAKSGLADVQDAGFANLYSDNDFPPPDA